MNEFEHQDLPADEQLRQALAGVAGIFESLLRRSDEYGAELAQARARQEAESERLSSLERALAVDRATVAQMSAVFGEVARSAMPAEPSRVDLNPPKREQFGTDLAKQPASEPVIHESVVAKPASAPVVGEPFVREPVAHEVEPIFNGGVSSLTADDLRPDGAV